MQHTNFIRLWDFTKGDFGEVFGIGSKPTLDFVISMLGVEITDPIRGWWKSDFLDTTT
jgi:hypothetical protein